ncbi:MAG: 1-acyl-sn-glycerol-3-phosphate acyltransferase [Streptosporangiaceae bacterium]|jgi:hypothetical protein
MYWVFKSTVLVALRIWFRPTVSGLHNLPSGPAIVASNHLSFSDSFFLGAVISRRLTFLAKSSYFDRPGVKKAPLFIRFGEPLEFSSSEASLDDLAVLRRVTDQIMREVRRLSGQEYMDSYSPGPLKSA